MFTENQYLAQQTPSGAVYDEKQLFNVRRRSPRAFINLTERRFKPFKKSSDPSPVTYSILAAQQNNKLRSKQPVFSVGKEESKSFVVRESKIKAFVPAPCSYDPDKSKGFVTLGARRGYK